ncbi:MAG: prepilin-type N-terminal cleavage/methylation domain-containing protein [Patescibacteria group bacterium]
MPIETNSKKNAVRSARPLTRTPLGFTLAELIVVVTVLAILATIGFVALSGHISSARDSARATEIGQISRSVELSAVQNGKYPMPVAAEGAALVSFTGGVSGNALVTQ